MDRCTKCRNGKKNWRRKKKWWLRKSSQEKFKRRFIDVVREPLPFSVNAFQFSWLKIRLFKVFYWLILKCNFLRNKILISYCPMTAGAVISWKIRSSNWLSSLNQCCRTKRRISFNGHFVFSFQVFSPR